MERQSAHTHTQRDSPSCPGPAASWRGRAHRERERERHPVALVQQLHGEAEHRERKRLTQLPWSSSLIDRQSAHTHREKERLTQLPWSSSFMERQSAAAAITDGDRWAML